MKQRLKSVYTVTLVSQYLKNYVNYNTYQVPKLKKIVINQGLGQEGLNSKSLAKAKKEMTLLCGQKPVVTRSKKAISAFKIKSKAPVGLTVVLRSTKMYAFLERLITLALPRIRDFRGIEIQSFDGHGNFNLGLENQLMFPEILYDQIEDLRGMDIAMVTTAKTDPTGLWLLKGFGLPFCN